MKRCFAKTTLIMSGHDHLAWKGFLEHLYRSYDSQKKSCTIKIPRRYLEVLVGTQLETVGSHESIKFTNDLLKKFKDLGLILMEKNFCFVNNNPKIKQGDNTIMPKMNKDNFHEFILNHALTSTKPDGFTKKIADQWNNLHPDKQVTYQQVRSVIAIKGKSQKPAYFSLEESIEATRIVVQTIETVKNAKNPELVKQGLMDALKNL